MAPTAPSTGSSRALFGAAILVAAAAAVAPAADGRIPVYQPTTITQPGSYYVTRDLTGSSGQPVITVDADNVTLDLNGHTLFVQPGGSGVYAGARNAVRVTNGKIYGGDSGIWFVSSTGGDYTVDHLEVWSQSGAGFGYGIAIWSNSGGFPSTRAVITDNKVVGVYGAVEGHGIYVQNVYGGSIARNDIVRPKDRGIFVSASRGVTVADNVVTEASNAGIYAETSNNCTFARNDVKNGNTGTGISFLNSDNNALEANVVIGSPQYGIYLSDTSTGNVYSDNRLIANGSGNYFGVANVSALGNNAGGANF